MSVCISSIARTGLPMLAVASSLAIGGPVEVYREGTAFCPRDRLANARPLTETLAVERARTLLPADFCGPTSFVSGCDAEPEYALGAWRIYFHQYRLRDARHDWGGLAHNYVILDGVGNCFANIPGTEQGAPR